MIKCLAVDDEPLALEQLKMYISKVPFLELVDACHDAYEAIQALEGNPIDVIFADINMPDLNGIDFAKSLNASAGKSPMFVFTTAYADYAVEGFKVNAIDYLLKPFGFDEFLVAANKVRTQYELVNTPREEKMSDGDFIYVKVDHRRQRISIPSIRYVEGMAEYVRIYVEGEKKPYTALFSMKRMEEVLGSNIFLRVHKSYIVNMAKAQAVAKTSVQLDADTFIPVGDSYRAGVLDFVSKRTIGK